jgi:hypothetical protein
MGGGSGKQSVPMFTRWMFKLQGMYALPYGFSISGSLSGREGMLRDEYFYLYNYDLPNRYDRGEYIRNTVQENRTRLPDMWVLNLKLEKMLSLGDTGKVWISADVFNALNNQSMNRERSSYYGSYEIEPSSGWTGFYSNRRHAEPNESLNPLIIRFGLRFQF